MKKRPTRIKIGSVSLPIYEHRDGWRVAYKEQGRWKYITRSEYDDAAKLGKAKAIQIHNGTLDLSTITPAQSALARQFLELNPTQDDIDHLRARKASPVATIAATVAKWHAHKLAELGGVESRTLRGDMNWLDKLAAHFSQSAIDITTEELQAFIELATSPKTRKAHRARIRALWKFAKAHEIFDSTAADRLPAYRIQARSIDILTPTQARTILAAVAPEFQGWLALALFSGLRPQEIVSRSESKKPSLRWENIRRADNLIDVPAIVAKRRKRRTMPILPTLSAWLDHIDPPESGRICIQDPSRTETGRLGALIGGWPRNVLRHSYGSYRAGVLKSLPELALEMGNSVSMIETHYRECVSATDVEEFWNLTPSDVLRM